MSGWRSPNGHQAREKVSQIWGRRRALGVRDRSSGPSKMISMPFYSRRKELDALTEREAAGESFWTSTFDQTVRTKIEYAFKDACPTRRGSQEAMAQRAESLILRDEGLRYLPGTDNQPAGDVFGYLVCCPDDMVPMVVEAVLAAFAPRLPDNSDAPSMALANRSRQLATKSILTQHRISFELDGNQMVPFSSREMHVAVVTPTLTLLAGNMRFEQVEVAYQDALKEISNGQPSDAITDAGTALQIMRKALGAEGSSLGPLH